MLQLITILNRCHRFPGFVYQKARFSSDHKSIEIAMRPRKGSKAICSRCHQPGPGYDQLVERRFEFIPFWGFLAVWRPSGQLGEKLTTLARNEAALNQKRGYPLAFQLENPVT